MKLEGDYVFEASVPEVWSALFDPVILAAVKQAAAAPADPPAARDAPAAAPAEASEAAFSTEETVKTGAPSYIAVPNEDPTVRTTRPTAPPADKAAAPEVAFTPVKVKQSA